MLLTGEGSKQPAGKGRMYQGRKYQLMDVK